MRAYLRSNDNSCKTKRLRPTKSVRLLRSMAVHAESCRRYELQLRRLAQRHDLKIQVRSSQKPPRLAIGACPIATCRNSGRCCNVPNHADSVIPKESSPQTLSPDVPEVHATKPTSRVGSGQYRRDRNRDAKK
ncbi:hypothetical protein CGZ80_00940 [Rhodopirellula sp. MGV]|nr:hypothetical protein CGZ80_00940 [Rhodopirellula sp. MGV]PNY37632.1 hypothetical protein C2E31_06675 [Rhodopirellula baltica]